ncbi:FAD dependent oxidoreductase [Melanomma pulvis-pyrius CBS 109.77]|uniref:FAD dependent oxidoreductase n=1 Tax=Melanomma pulvis-pyrius CBS 109.77 TaxID=1314802 RepID=A0A6A6XT13_9PLEO|nr:FAD dependent oxidoreductase [Melanomma pulvis-pyrius CBS 109.77]
MSPLSKDAPINIVGAGVFGLSTALHLARRGYRNVTVFDKQPYDTTLYSYLNGCDAASADMNKIIRSAYGSQVEYQELTFEAIEAWKAWNSELATGNDLPLGMSKDDKVFYNCGNLSMTDGNVLPAFELATIKTMEECGHKDTQLITTDARHASIAESRGQGFALDPFHRKSKGKSNLGVLDSTGGVAVADKACRLALHKARGHGAKFVLDPVAGAFASFIADVHGKTIGIKTKDGRTHEAALTIMACGGWTPSLLTRLDHLCETTAGSVILYKIPQHSPLFQRFSPEAFPTWLWKVRDGAKGGLYGFPRDEAGYLKIGYRGTKYTNPKPQADGKERSVPVTRWSEGEKLKQIPEQAMKVLKGFVAEYLPELKEEGIDVELSRVCWYTDTFDNHFVVDRVPGDEGLFVATGGSGHAFKYLPNIGNWVVDVLEGAGEERPAVKAWKWRSVGVETPVNLLMEGSAGERALANVRLAEETNAAGNRAKL